VLRVIRHVAVVNRLQVPGAQVDSQFTSASCEELEGIVLALVVLRGSCSRWLLRSEFEFDLV
jgi:hypothetical protein